MRKRIISALRAAGLPVSRDGSFISRYAITSAGSLAVLRTDIDIDAAWRSASAGAESPIPTGVRCRLSIFDGAQEKAPIEFLYDTTIAFDRATNGNWLVAGCGPPDGSFRIFDADGRLLREFSVGRYFEHIQWDRDGGFWVGYRDEVFGGTVKFDEYGKVVSEVNAPFHCYALNVGRDQTLSYGYTDFDIISIDRTLQKRIRECPVRFAEAIAIQGDLALLAGGGFEGHDSVALVMLQKDQVKLVDEFILDPAPDGRSSALPLIGREDMLHYSRDGAWYRLSVADVCRFAELIPQ